MKIKALLIFGICIIIIGCANKTKQNNTTEVTLVTSKDDSIESKKRETMWEKANKYKASITDTTFLKIKGNMSDAAIDPFNPNYAFNQVVYLKALERAKKHLSFQNNQLVFPIKNGSDIYMSEDLYKFISETFNLWNEQLKSGNCELKKDEKGLYDLYPKATNTDL
ncbi:hypothetical protein [Phocaeicola plebeius]|jgi:hypothetical protein